MFNRQSVGFVNVFVPSTRVFYCTAEYDIIVIIDYYTVYRTFIACTRERMHDDRVESDYICMYI